MSAVTAIERDLGSVYTADTLAALVRRFPQHRFLWLMGADNLAQFHRWRDWRRLAREVPIAVIARPGYDRAAHAAVAMGWLRRFVRPADQATSWTTWRLPALVLLRFRPDPSSATRLRAADPHWQRRFLPHSARAFLTGLKQKGHVIMRDKGEGGSRYRIGHRIGGAA